MTGTLQPFSQIFFLYGLADYIKDDLVSYKPSSSVDGLIELATRLDLHIQAQRRQGTARPPQPVQLQGTTATTSFIAATGPQQAGPEPLQLGCTGLSPEKRERRRQANLLQPPWVNDPYSKPSSSRLSHPCHFH